MNQIKIFEECQCVEGCWYVNLKFKYTIHNETPPKKNINTKKLSLIHVLNYYKCIKSWLGGKFRTNEVNKCQEAALLVKEKENSWIGLKINDST